MGAYTAEPVLVYELLFYDVPNPADRTNKWNMVIREEPAPAGAYHYQSFAIVGTLDQVVASMQALYRLHPVDIDPPSGYVDVANCQELAGWAWDPKAPDVPMIVDIFDVAPDGTRALIFSAEAGVYRSDLPPVLGDNGVHGFAIPTGEVIADGAAHLLEFEVRNSVEGLASVALIPKRHSLTCP
jgi:hypothetical protein